MHNICLVLLPELGLFSIAIIVQTLALFYRKFSRAITIFAIFGLFTIAAISIYFASSLNNNLFFRESFYITKFIFYIKAIMILLLGIIILSRFCINIAFQGEYLFLLMFSTIGSCIAISSRDLMLLFCALELQSISNYAILGLNNKQNQDASEAAIKYFALGSFFSCLALFGISFIYGFSGHLNFFEIANFLQTTEVINLGFMLGLLFILFNLLFKLSAAPFHYWVPDVYTTADVFSLMYFGSLVKISVAIVFSNIVKYFIMYLDNAIYSQVIKILAVFSMLIGVFAALKQHLIKRLIAYSGILNTGYFLIATSVFNLETQNVAIYFIITYSLSIVSFFLCNIVIFGKNVEFLSFDDLIQIGFKNKFLSLLILINIFSMLGIPPFVGFIVKYLMFFSAFENGAISLTFLAFVLTVVSGYFYLKIIAYMYFYDNQTSASNKNFELNDNFADHALSAKRTILLLVTSILSFTIFLSPIILTLYSKSLYQSFPF